jgi:hypothetical protein
MIHHADPHELLPRSEMHAAPCQDPVAPEDAMAIRSLLALEPRKCCIQKDPKNQEKSLLGFQGNADTEQTSAAMCILCFIIIIIIIIIIIFFFFFF